MPGTRAKLLAREFSKQSPQKPFHIRFRTVDGNLIMDRKSDADYYIRHGIVDKFFTEHSLGIDAREKGVRILSKTVTAEGIDAV